MERPWSYWTRNKLEILGAYLEAFNRAANQKSNDRVYLDLMAGKPYNIDRDTKERFDGSPLIAMRANPHFSRLRFCELEDNALALETALRDQCSGDTRYKVVHEDCNKAIDATLAEFAPYRRLTELTMVADSVREPVDNSAARSIPVRRLACTAAQWIDRLAGLLAYVEDTSEVWVRPENADPKIYSAAQIANQALSLGLPVRPTVAAELNVRTRTVDRLLAKAKAEGWFDDQRKFTA